MILRRLVKGAEISWSPASVPCIGLALFLAIPSAGQVQKYLGLPTAAAYVFLLLLFFLAAYQPILLKFLQKVTLKQGIWIATATVMVLAAAFWVVYPIADSGVVGGGADRDEALGIAAEELLNGRYPYKLETYLGNPISPLPGAVILAIPFVLMGNSAYQIFFWLPIFAVVISCYFRPAAPALALLLTALLLSPVILRGVATGSDLLSNSLYVFIFAFLMIRCVTSPDAKLWQKVLFAALLGLGLSSRPNFILALPLLFSILAQNGGWKSAVKYTGITCFVLLAVTLPFYLYSPQEFSPLHVSSKLESPIPHTDIAVPVMAGVMALALSLQRMSRRCVVFFRNFGFVSAFLVLSMIVLKSLDSNTPTLRIDDAGELVLIFGAFAFFTCLLERDGRFSRYLLNAEKNPPS